jgi:hypothetical protein
MEIKEMIKKNPENYNPDFIKNIELKIKALEKDKIVEK